MVRNATARSFLKRTGSGASTGTTLVRAGRAMGLLVVARVNSRLV
jgi:hypothetical protein